MVGVSARAIAAAVVVAGSLSLAVGTADAAVWTSVGPASGFLIGTNTVTFSPTPANAIRYIPTNLNPQNPDSVKSYVLDAFPSAGTLTTVGACNTDGAETPAASCTHSGGSASYNGSAFNYLAVHFGQNELVFYFASAISSFELSGLPKDWSNFRAYTTSAVPLPAAALLFGTAVAGLAGFKRRRADAAA